MVQENQFKLLGTRRFLPLFITQFLGAFHDNLFKNALVALLLYTTWIHTDADPKMLTTLAAGVFICPYIFFSAIGGQLADKYDKRQVIRTIKFAEVIIAVVGATAVMTGSLYVSFFTLFLLGTHSAFFSPSKFSILPQHLHDGELVSGNALVNTGTFLAILLGTIVGTSLVLVDNGHVYASLSFIVCALVGYVVSCQIPPAPARDPDLKINLNPITETIRILGMTFTQKKQVVRAILGMSWFYFMGGMFLAQIPNYTKETFGADENVLIFFLTLFSVGIAIGGLVNHRLLKGRIEGVFVPLAALGMSLFSLDLYFANAHITRGTDDTLLTLSAFLSYPAHWRVIFDIAMVAVCGGLYVVPLNAIVQHESPDHMRSRILAGSAIIDSVFIVLSSVVSAILISRGFSIPELFFTFALANFAVAIYICSILPDYLLKTCLQILFKLMYRVEVIGAENIALAGPRAVIVANHVSLLDPPILAAFIPGRPMFAVNKFVAEWKWVKPFLRLVDAFPLDPTNPFSMKTLIRKVDEGRHVVIFPEGRLTETGALMKVYDGPGMVADKTGAMILPVRLDGVQYLSWARLKGKFPVLMFPKITITILPPQKFHVPDEIKGRARRQAAGRQLFDLMEDMMFVTANRSHTLWNGLVEIAGLHGGQKIIAEDIAHKPMTFKKLIQGSVVMGHKLADITAPGENVGVMVPNSLGALVTFFGLQSVTRVPAMINYSNGPAAISACLTTAQIKMVITSRKFVAVGKLDALVKTIEEQAKIVYLEDIQKNLSFADKLIALLPETMRKMACPQAKPDTPAVVLFTSGSEGTPKGVVLSHNNLNSNIQQLAARVDFNAQDILFNALPMFHSFGLTGGVLLPVLSGVRTFLYPSPLHYRVIPEMVYTTNATIMFGTNTFLQGYARMAEPYDFYRMRYIFAGAERVEETTRRIYLDRFGVKVLEGYGATETSPVIAVNSAMHYKSGTTGRILPGIQKRLDDVPGVTDGKRLFVRGPNVMMGYYKFDQPGVLQPPVGGWHDTGDIVKIDDAGFVTILGRAKRFAKIAGEMVSLGAVEQLAASLWPDALHAAVAVNDPRKGERVVLITTQTGADRGAMTAAATQKGVSNLTVPADIVIVDKMPLLGSGKIDYTGANDIITKKDAT